MRLIYTFVGLAGLGEGSDVELLVSLSGEVLLVGLSVVLLLDGSFTNGGSSSGSGLLLLLGVTLSESLSLEFLLALLSSPSSSLSLLRVAKSRCKKVRFENRNLNR